MRDALDLFFVSILSLYHCALIDFIFSVSSDRYIRDVKTKERRRRRRTIVRITVR